MRRKSRVLRHGEDARGACHDCEIYGRVIGCMLGVGSTLKTPHVRGFHTWPRGEGGHAVEWAGGPDAAAVFAELEELAADNDVTTLLLPGDVTRASELEYFTGWVGFRARGVVFQLRPA